MCSATLPTASATPPRRQQHPNTAVDDVLDIFYITNNPNFKRTGVPRLGLQEGSTWAPIGLARDRGDRSERGSGAGAPTPPQG